MLIAQVAVYHGGGYVLVPDCSDGLVFKLMPRNVPTLSEWGLIAMAGLIGIIGLYAIRRKKAAV